MFIIVGLGNPGEKYENTRHNTGRMVLDVFRRSAHFPEWKLDSKIKAFTSSGTLGKETALLVLPETFMNKSGEAVRRMTGLKFRSADKKKEIANLAVIHDDLDIPFGFYKISFNKSSGGHKGVESIIRALKTQAFVRVRVGISPKKKPQGEVTVEKHILGNFTSDQLDTLRALSKRIAEALLSLVKEGREKAMSRYNYSTPTLYKR